MCVCNFNTSVNYFLKYVEKIYSSILTRILCLAKKTRLKCLYFPRII